MAADQQKTRIAIIVPRLEALGPVIVIQNLVNYLFDNENFAIKVFYLDNKVDNNIKISVPVELLYPGRFRFSDFDIIHTNGIRPDLFAYLNRKKIKYHISTIHNFVFEDLSFTYNSVISLFFGNIWLGLWKRADKLVCVSQALKEYYSKWFSSSKLEVIYNGTAEMHNSFTPDYEIINSIDRFRSEGLKVLGSAGILTARKGIGQILHLIAVEKEYAFVIIGAGKELPRLIRLSEKLKITQRCLFCGFRANAEGYYNNFDYFIMPSRSEGFGLALVEAVQQKVPVICSDIKVFKELFTNDEVTFFMLDNLVSLKEALKLSAKRGNVKSEHAYDRYFKDYTAGIMAKSYSNLYRSAVLQK